MIKHNWKCLEYKIFFSFMKLFQLNASFRMLPIFNCLYERKQCKFLLLLYLVFLPFSLVAKFFKLYCLPKILRNIENVRERPIISNYEIPMENVSKCLDFHLKNDLQGGISYEKSFNDFKSKMSTFLSLSLSCSLCNCWCNWAIPEYNSWDWFIDMFFKVIGYGHRLKICFIICLYLYEYIRNKCS